MIRVGVIGLGFMGATHIAAYRAAAAAGFACRLAAVADRSPERLSGIAAHAPNPGAGSGERLFDPAELRTYDDPRALVADEGIDLISICTHTDTHVPLALAALRAGKHVLVEKPVGLDATEVRGVAEAAYRAGKLCMPAMCVRFWPAWTWLRERIRDGTLGRVRSATFQRLGAPPSWSTGFYADTSRSGGSLFDLHIHDADFINWCFGPVSEVSSVGSLAHVTTQYRFDSVEAPDHVVAEGGQDHNSAFGFRMRYVVNFERDGVFTTADFDLAREQGGGGGRSLLLYRAEAAEHIELPALSGYDGEVRHLLDSIMRGRRNDQLAATIDDAVEVTRILEAEVRSINSRAPARVT